MSDDRKNSKRECKVVFEDDANTNGRIDSLCAMPHPIRQKIVKAMSDIGPMYIKKIIKFCNGDCALAEVLFSPKKLGMRW